jgi:hypothetical protein
MWEQICPPLPEILKTLIHPQKFTVWFLFQLHEILDQFFTTMEGILFLLG